MPTPIKRNDTTLIFDLRDFAPLDEANKYLLCLNENTYHVIFSLFAFYGHWLNRYTPNSDGDIWYKAENNDAVFVHDMYDRGMEELQMTVCFDELIEAINTNFQNLTEAVQALQLSPVIEVETSPPGVNVTVNPASPDVNLTCSPDVNVSVSGGGNCGAKGNSSNCAPGGYGLIPAVPSDGQTEIGSGPGGYTPPATWEDTTEAYVDYKCKAATFLAGAYISYIDKCISQSNNLALMSASVFFELVLSEWFLALLSPALLLAIFAYWLTLLAGTGDISIYLADYKGNLTDTKDQFICDLYNAPSVSEARTIITAWISDNLPVGIPSSWVDYHVNNLFPDSVVNILFEHYEAVDSVTGEDCSGCGGCNTVTLGTLEVDPFVRGVLLHEGPDYYRIRSVPYGGEHLISFFVNLTEDRANYCGDCATSVTFTDVDDFNGSFGSGSVYHYGCPRVADPPSETLIYNGLTIPACCDNVSSMYFRSSTQFEIQFTVNDTPCP